jgi:hypothetical protein
MLGDMRKRQWATLAGIGQAQWFFGNLYEAVVDVPRLLADARPNREPGLLAAGSPVRYYLPTAPLTLAATAVTLIDSWRSGGDRRAVGVAAASTASAVALTAYLVKTVNVGLLRDGDASERRDLVTTWHRANLARLCALAVAATAMRQALPGHVSGAADGGQPVRNRRAALSSVEPK